MEPKHRPPPDSPELDEVAQFTIPRRAAKALDISAIVEAARAAGVPRPRLEMNDKDAGGKTRITCRVAMALHVIEVLERMSENATRRQDTQVLVACSEAIVAAFKGLEDARKRFHGPPPDLRTSMR
jgi:hypothetical protein